MRTTRIIILIVFLTATFFVLVRAISTQRTKPAQYPITGRPRRSFLGIGYYNTPFSLFPPNAAISLTDDNSTSFAARPAAFGPRLASTGLSGQLWVGSGFVEDAVEGNGELGCSDITGWGRGHKESASKDEVSTPKEPSPKIDDDGNKLNHDTKAQATKSRGNTLKYNEKPDVSSTSIHGQLARRDTVTSSHADIQSIQEAAEIQGKIALLMRGGCGFLEKVMWAQRRGAIAVIVGDNMRGGPLIQMYARSDESEDVSIPSVFTARTTAQLLSSLTQPGTFRSERLDDQSKPTTKAKKAQKKSIASIPVRSGSRSTSDVATHQFSREKRDGWISRVLGRSAPPQTDTGSSRPPSSGRLDWELVRDWSDEKDQQINEVLQSKKKKKPQEAKQPPSDNFVIGVHDWRDPDLVDKKPQETPSQRGSDKKPVTKLEKDKPASKEVNSKGPSTPEEADRGTGLMGKIFGSAEQDSTDDDDDDDVIDNPPPEIHEGLWVTVTPTNGASPFLDTLLVLVVSPLVTLSVVYALLIVRARIRRRRWRAPKSVVERLPVRTYHTVATSPSVSSRNPSPSCPNPTTPLLQRPRSKTTTGVPENNNFLAAGSSIQPIGGQSSRGRPRDEREKGAGGFSAEWRKYMGRQVECVVCLEEYVDGVSRVMSLPCGHEFHAECITPWLTTRRRTCPICKGDVVRSLKHHPQSTPRYEPYNEDSDGYSNGGESGSRTPSGGMDVEQGAASATRTQAQTQTPNSLENWYGVLSNSFGGRQRVPSRSPSPDQRS